MVTTTMLRAKSALLEEFDIDRLPKHFKRHLHELSGLRERHVSVSCASRPMTSMSRFLMERCASSCRN